MRYRRETAYGGFERRIPLPESVDEQSIHAVQGRILQITMKGVAKALAADGEESRLIRITTCAEQRKSRPLPKNEDRASKRRHHEE